MQEALSEPHVANITETDWDEMGEPYLSRVFSANRDKYIYLVENVPPDNVLRPEEGIVHSGGLGMHDLVDFCDLKRDGIRLLHSNISMGQDAFAFRLDGSKFVVCDGMGNSRKSGALAHQLVHFIAKSDTDISEWQDDRSELMQFLEEIKGTERFIEANEGDGDHLHAGKTTLAILEKRPDGKWAYLILGDSPVFLFRSERLLKATGLGLYWSRFSPGGLVIEDQQAKIIGDMEYGVIDDPDGIIAVLGSDWITKNGYLISQEGQEAITHLKGAHGKPPESERLWEVLLFRQRFTGFFDAVINPNRKDDGTMLKVDLSRF